MDPSSTRNGSEQDRNSYGENSNAIELSDLSKLEENLGSRNLLPSPRKSAPAKSPGLAPPENELRKSPFTSEPEEKAGAGSGSAVEKSGNGGI